MPDFGYNSVGASNVNSLSRGFGHGNAAQQHRAGANDTITSLHMFTRNIGGTAEVGVYDMGVGGTPAGATLIATATITASSDTAQWEQVAVNIPLTQGHDYFLAYVSSNGIRRYFDTGVSGDSTEDLSASAGVLQASWSEGATDSEIVSLYATYTTGAPARAITGIDGDNDVQPGQTVSFTGSGLVPPFVSATLGGQVVTLAGNESATGGDVTIPADINAEWGATDLDFVLTDQTGALTINNVTLSTPAGWETVTFNGVAPDPEATESFYEYAQVDLNIGLYTMLVNDVLAWESAVGLSFDQQTIPRVEPPATVAGNYKIWKSVTSEWTPLSTYLITDGGAVTGLVSVEDMVSETYLDAVEIGLVKAVQVEDLQSDSYMDSVSVTLSVTVAVDDMYSAAILDTVSLNSEVIVTVEDAYSETYLDVVNIAPVIEVVIEDMYSISVLDQVPVALVGVRSVPNQIIIESLTPWFVVDSLTPEYIVDEE